MTTVDGINMEFEWTTFNVVVVVFDIEFVKPNLGGLVSNGNGAIFVVLDLGIAFLPEA